MSWVKDAGNAISALGEYCRYVDPGTGCSTWVLIFDAGKLKKFTEGTPAGSYCAPLQAIQYSSGALKASYVCWNCLG